MIIKGANGTNDAYRMSILETEPIHSVGHVCDHVDEYRPRSEAGLGDHHVGEVPTKSMKSGLRLSIISDTADFEPYSHS